MVLSSFAAYGAGKAALNQLTRNLAVELAPLVRVNAIGVGGVATKGLEVVLTDDAPARPVRGEHARCTAPASPRTSPARRSTSPRPASSWVTGKVLQVDGGTERPSIDVPAPPLSPTSG